MANMPKQTIELFENSSTPDTYTTVVTRGATAVSDGTALTVPGGTTATGRIQEAIMKGVLAAINDLADGN